MNDFFKKKLLFALLTLSVFFLFSCGSTKFEGEAVFVGRVSDMAGKPVENYHILLCNGRETLTDSAGMFFFRDVPSGFYHLSGGGDGWESFAENVEFSDRRMVICVQVRSLDSLIDEIDDSLLFGNVSGVKKILGEAEKYNKRNSLFLCLKNLILYGECPSEENRNSFLSSLEKI